MSMPYARKKVHMVLQFLCAIKFSIYKGIDVFTYFLVQFHLYFKSLIFNFFSLLAPMLKPLGHLKLKCTGMGSFQMLVISYD